MDAIAAYLPQDRLQALARGEALPDRVAGAALFADISGFTPLTEALAEQLGPRRGAEALTHQLDAVYDALIAKVELYGGSVLGFAGDAIMCWFEDRGVGSWELGIGGDTPAPNPQPLAPAALRATACALELQTAMLHFSVIALPNGTTIALALKVAVASGTARRLVVGDPAIQLLDALAGATIARTALAEHLAQSGETLVDAAAAAMIGAALDVAEWRVDEATGERFAVLRELKIENEKLRNEVVSDANHSQYSMLNAQVLRPWLLPAVYDRERSGQGTFLTEFRPVVALFLRFEGLDYDGDAAGAYLDTFIRRMQAGLARHEGTLLQLTIGDKGSYFYAAFGAPIAHEDDARRAVQAALDLRATSAELGFLAPVQIGLSRGTMRAGAYGGATRCTYGVLGDDVNLAARLMGLAAPGEVLVSGRVQAAVANQVDCEPRPPIQLKGKAEPLPVFAVTGVQQGRAIRLQEPTYTLPMIGRQRELAVIDQKLTLALQGHGQVVGLRAEAGMGKSRLVAEIIRLARRRHFTGYGGACRSDGVNSPYLVWMPIWRAFFDLDPAAPFRRQIRALEGELEIHAPERVDALPLLGTLLGMSLPDNEFTSGLEPRDRKSTLEALLVDCMTSAAREAMANGGGLLLVLEDLHWIDPASHDLLEEAARACGTLPVLIVLAYRPPDLQRLQTPRVEELLHFTSITLTELSAAEAEQAIRAKLAQLFPERSGAVPPALFARLTEKAQGNPFYLEELLNYLRDRGLDPREQTALDRITLPDSLHSLILSRIDQLTTQQKLTLKVASIIGRQFGFDHLCGYYPSLGAPEPIKADLDVLASLELTPLDTPEPELAYLFKHIVTHEVAYENLAYATRAALHEQYARFLEAQAGDDIEPRLDLLAYHYDHTDNLTKRREYLRRAGQAAQAAYANPAALDYYERLVPLIANGRDQIDIHMKLGAVLELTGRWADAEARYQEALAWADRVNDTAARAHAQHALGKLFRLRGVYDAALAWLEQARATWATLDDRAELSRTLAEIGLMFWYTGAYADAKQHLEASLALAREHGEPAGIAVALNHLGLVVRNQGDYAAAHALYNESLALRQALGDKRGIAWALNNLGGMAFAQGDYTVAQAHFEASLALRRDIGDKQGIATSLVNLGIVADEHGDFAAARALYNQSLALQQEIGDKSGAAHTLGNLGLVAAAQGDYAAAQANYSASQALQRALGDKQGIAAGSMYLGLLALAQRQPDQAQVLFGESLAQFYAIGDKRFVAHCLASLAVLVTDESVEPLTATRASQAARLSGATTSIMESLDIQLDREVREPYERAISMTQARLGDQAFAALVAEGQQMTLDEAVAFALAPAS